jgi:hypothetical protein
MGGDYRFWTLFGGIWLLVGIGFVGASLGFNLFADPDTPTGAPPWLFALFGLLGVAAGGAIIFFAYRTMARDRRLTQSGVPLTATVVDVRRSPIDINRQTRWHVVYRYEHTKGQPLEGKSRALPGHAVSSFKPGDRVQIKVDPQKPEESLFLGEPAG